MRLSGSYWVTQFPGSASIADLEPDFRQRVQEFIGAINSARTGVADARPANARPGVPNGAGRAPGLAAQADNDIAHAEFKVIVPEFLRHRAHGVRHAQAPPRVHIDATYRPAQRAYLMHYSWLISRNQIDPTNVPSYQPIGDMWDSVDIQWVHRDPLGRPDILASRRAALEMVNGLGMANLHVAPALRSKHVFRRAVDMKISWVGNMEIAEANLRTVLINTLPRDGTNRRLIEVGATYGVHHLRNVGADRPHWSNDGT